MIKRMALGILILAAFLAGVLITNTLRFTSTQVDVEPLPPLDFDLDSAVQRLSDAVRFRTISNQDPALFDKQAFLEMHSFLKRSFPLVHKNLKREMVVDYSLLYTWEGTDSALKPVVLMAHLDVVPVAPGTDATWEHDAFSGDISDGYVWGRGTMDDKVNVMAILEAVELLLADGVQPDRTVYLAFGHDEELAGTVNGASAIAALLVERGVKAEYVLDEGGAIVTGTFPGLDAPVATVGVAEKGYVTVELSVHGKGGHSSQPAKRTKIGMLSGAIHRLETEQMSASIDGTTRMMLERIGPETGFPNNLIMANLWLTAPLVKQSMAAGPATNAMVRTTTAPTIFDAGVKENVMPAHARAVVNFRILPGDTVDSVIEHVRAVVDDSQIEIRKLENGATDPSKISSADTPAFEAIETTIRELVPDAIVAPYLVLGATDARHFGEVSENIYRFALFRLEASDLSRFHGVNERVGIENYGQMIHFFHRVIERTATSAHR